MEAKKKDNVIQFPGPKKTETAPPPAPVPEAKAAEAPKPPRKLPSTLAGLAILVLASLFANRWQSGGETDMSSTAGFRGIASVSENVIAPQDRDSQWEHSLAKDLAARPRRDLASVRLGQRPSLGERLHFGTLKSQYAVTMDGGKLKAAQWSASDSEAPVYLRDKSEFLLEYRDLMPVDFDAPVALSREEGKDGIREVFALVDGAQATVAEVRFDLDGFGRLRGFEVVSPTSGQ